MADYHPLILRAVEGLDKNTSENRRALYERARTALVAQLRGVVPALDESEITRERLSLEEAIRKVEAESARRAREEPRPPPQPRRFVEPRREEPRAAPPPPPPPPPPAPLPQEPPAADASSWAELEQTAAMRDTPRERPLARTSLTDEAMRGFRDAVGTPGAETPRPAARQPAPQEPSYPPARTPEPARAERREARETYERRRQPQPESPPPAAATQPTSFEFSDETPSVASRPRRPEQRAHEEPPERRRPRVAIPGNYGKALRFGLIALLGILLGVLGWWQRGNISGAASSLIAMVSGSSTPAPRTPATSTQRPKITDRIGQPQTQPSDAPAVAQRVVLYEEDPNDPQGKRMTGSAVWRTEMMAPAPGRPAELAVRAEVDVPERNMKMFFSLRRNADQSLPASHTIEIMFNLAPDHPSGGVQNVPGVLMKQAEQTRGVPLAGLAVKVTPGFFLIGLSAIEADMQRNIQLLKERSWFDIPMVYANNRRAILAMEKGTPGERAFADAFAAWRQ